MTNEQKIWNKLINAGLTVAGAAGLMGNLYAESGLNPVNLENQYEQKLGFTDTTYTRAVDAGTYTNFVNDCAGYGLAQWTYHTRKAKLLTFAKDRGCSVGDLDMQIDFLLCELRESYPAVWRTLTTADNVRAASDAVMIQFERPADTSETARRRRAKFGVQFYKKLAGTTQNADSELPDELEHPPCPEQCPDTVGVRMLADEIRAGTWGTDWEMNVVAAVNVLVEAGAGRTHTVRNGDTLLAIAKKYDTTVSTIVSENREKYPKITENHIVVGWVLTV